jgi:hypothetical protein
MVEDAEEYDLKVTVNRSLSTSVAVVCNVGYTLGTVAKPETSTDLNAEGVPG